MNPVALRIETDETSLVDAILECMLTEKPDMLERYSDDALARTREDAAFHLQHLVAALLVEDPEMFSDYYAWLLNVLLPRGIVMEDIDINFRCVEVVLEERYGKDASEPLRYLRQRHLSASRSV